MATENDFMTEALVEARAGDTMFGAVLVSGDEIMARAHNTTPQTGDPSAHAELNLIREFCQRESVALLPGFTLYTTAEPCPMCAALCSFTGVSSVVYGVSVAELIDLGAPQINLSCEEVVRRGSSPVSVRGGVLRDACLAHCRTLTERSG